LEEEINLYRQLSGLGPKSKEEKEVTDLWRKARKELRQAETKLLETEASFRARSERIQDLNREVETSEAMLKSTMATIYTLGLAEKTKEELMSEATGQKLLDLRQKQEQQLLNARSQLSEILSAFEQEKTLCETLRKDLEVKKVAREAAEAKRRKVCEDAMREVSGKAGLSPSPPKDPHRRFSLMITPSAKKAPPPKQQRKVTEADVGEHPTFPTETSEKPNRCKQQ